MTKLNPLKRAEATGELLVCISLLIVIALYFLWYMPGMAAKNASANASTRPATTLATK